MSDSIEAIIDRLSDLPVFFVAGLPRSGTTWLQQMLNAHPQVLCLGESHFINEMLPELYAVLTKYTKQRENKDRTWAPGVVGPSARQMEPIFRTAFAALAAANLGDKDIDKILAVGEKNPDNLMYAERIWRVFPGARMIHIIRDPRDGAVSAFTRFRPRLPKELTRPQYVAVYAKDWAKRISAARSAAANQTYTEIRYEDLHANTPARAAEIFRFIGVSDDPSDVEIATTASSFERLSGGRKQGEADATSHYRRGEVGGWRDDLTPEEVELAEKNAGEMMAALGYSLARQGGSR